MFFCSSTPGCQTFVCVYLKDYIVYAYNHYITHKRCNSSQIKLTCESWSLKVNKIQCFFWCEYRDYWLYKASFAAKVDVSSWEAVISLNGNSCVQILQWIRYERMTRCAARAWNVSHVTFQLTAGEITITQCTLVVLCDEMWLFIWNHRLQQHSFIMTIDHLMK